MRLHLFSLLLLSSLIQPVQYINEDESEQYDRQIRLWGVEAQQRMSGSRVLFSGINGVSNVIT